MRTFIFDNNFNSLFSAVNMPIFEFLGKTTFDKLLHNINWNTIIKHVVMCQRQLNEVNWLWIITQKHKFIFIFLTFLLLDCKFFWQHRKTCYQNKPTQETEWKVCSAIRQTYILTYMHSEGYSPVFSSQRYPTTNIYPHFRANTFYPSFHRTHMFHRPKILF